MTDTCSTHSALSDWRIYAAEIREAVLAREKGRATATPASQPDPDPTDLLGALSDAATLPDLTLTLRQELLILGLAATFGSRDALAAELDRGGITILAGIRSELVNDIAKLLRSALPLDFFIARSDRERQQPGAVTLIEPGLMHSSRSADELRQDLTAALMFRAPVILMLPEEIDASEVLGTEHPRVQHFRIFEAEIMAEFLARSFPGADAGALRRQLPSDAQLAETPMLWLMLALRCDSADAAAARLRRGSPVAGGFQSLRGTGSSASVRAEPGGIPLAELAGLGEARDIAIGITEDLRAWAAGTLDWRDVHRGLLVVGPPGCGKTELARAMSREPGIHLESGSYAAWQAAGHLGKMLEAMRHSFQRAAAHAPSILFIDEIDVVGSRTGRLTNQNEAYEEKVIGALLELLDGINGRPGVVVIAACNHFERIDPAIRRPGRFDEIVHVSYPDATALTTILRQHLGEDLADLDLMPFAQIALGRSGADCAAAVRMARAKARRARRPVAEQDLHTVLAPDHRALPAAIRQRAALHEAGHAIVAAALGLGTVKAVRLGTEGGETLIHWHPVDLTAVQAHRKCIVHLAGRAAELLVLGNVAGGAGGDPDADLARATRLLLACELSLGLGDHGHLSIGAYPDPQLVLSLPLQIRARLQRRLDRAIEDAQEILCQHHALLEELARDLEAAGYIAEAELTSRLGPLRDHAPNSVAAAS